MNSFGKDYLEIIDSMEPQLPIRTSVDFAGQALKRLEKRLHSGSHLKGYIRSHANPILFIMVFIINLLSVGIGLRSALQDSFLKSTGTSETTRIYIIDPSAYQLYNYCK